MHTIKPLDEDLLKEQAQITGAIVCAEEHQVWGGLGSAVAKSLSEKYPVPIEFIGMQDTYAESGTPPELFEKYGLSSTHIAGAAKKAVKRK